MRNFSGFLASILVVSTTFGGTIRDDRLDQRYRDMGSQYAAEGEVQFSDSQGSFLASGTLVGDRWILTAAHVVDAGTAPFGNRHVVTFRYQPIPIGKRQAAAGATSAASTFVATPPVNASQRARMTST